MHIYFLLLLIGSTSAFLPNGCPVSGHWLLPHETFCNKYYQCDHGSKVLRTCAPGTQFDIQLQICNWPHRFDCILGIRPEVATPENKYQSSTTNPRQHLVVPSESNDEKLLNDCPASGHWLLPHETFCNQYYQCNHGSKILRSCAPGTQFDIQLQICNWPHRFDCILGIRPEVATPENRLENSTQNPRKHPLLRTNSIDDLLPNGCPADFNVHKLLPHETDCSKFYSCSNGYKFLMNCGPGTVFDFDNQVCNWPHLVNCQSVSTSSTTQANSPNPEQSSLLPNGCPADLSVQILLPHESDCDKFYSCNKGDKILMTCPTGTLFDATQQICNWPDLVQCSIVTTVSTSISPTTDTPTTTTSSSTFTTSPFPITTSSLNPTTSYPFTTTSPFTTESIEIVSTTDVTHTSTTESDETTTNFYETTSNYPNTTASSTTSSIISTTTSFVKPTTITNTEYPVPITLSTITTESDETDTTKVTQSSTREDFLINTTTTEFQMTTNKEYEYETTTSVPSTNNILPEITTVEISTESDQFTTSGLYTSTISATSSPELPDCPLGIFGNFPHPDRCDAYYMCAGGVAILFNCSQGFEFDIDQKTCRPIAPGGCTMGPTTTVSSEVFTTHGWTTHEPSTDASSATNEAEVTSTVADDETIATTNSPNPPVLPECPLGIFGNFPHPERCDAYYMCAGGVVILFNCSQGFEFDIDQKTCRPIAPGGCTMGPTTTVPSEVFTTLGWTTHEPSTDASSATNEAEVTSTVADDETIATTNSPNPPVLPECPLGIFGNFPHPERCDAYYMCAGGVVILFNCSQGFEFDIDQKTCRPIAPGGCTMGPTTTVPSEVFTTLGWTTHEPSTDTSSATNEAEVTSTVADDETIATTNSPNPPVLPECPLGIFGNFPHPERCDAYYMCAGGVAILFNCSQGFEFDIDQKTCRPIAPGGCTMGPTTTVSSEVFTTHGWTTHEPSTDASSATNEAEVTSTVADDETIATTNSPNPPVLPECPLRIFGNFPHPERCDAYYMCAGGVAILFNCSQGFEFDIDQKTCRPIAPGGCTMGPTTTVSSEVFTTHGWTTHEPSTDASSATNEAEVTSTVADDETIATTNSPNPPLLPECPLGIFGNFPHPERCDAYYMCAGGVAILFNCSQGFEFDIDQKTCRPIAPGGCTMGSTTTVPSEVFTTHGWTTHEPSTDASSATNEAEVTSTVADDETIATTNSPNPPVLPECPPGIFGNFPHPERCDAYYMCAGGVAILFNCSQGFEFDIDQKTCRPIAPGGCTMGSTTTVPSEVFTTHGWTTHEPSTDASSATNEAEVTSTVADDETIATTNSPNPPVLPECPPGIFGNFPHPERCDAYYMCAGGVAILFNCSQGFEFDIAQKTCRPIAPGGCTMGPTTTVSAEVFTTHGWTTHEPSTDASSATNEAEVTSTVADDETIATTNSPNPPVLPECPLGIFGNFPHPERCDAYYMCAGGVAILFNCSQGFEFDIDQKTCRPIAPGGCTMGPTTTVPSEVFTTQDWTTHEPSTDASSATNEAEVTSTVADDETIATTNSPNPPVLPECPLGIFGNFPHPERCDAYYMCAGGVAILFNCSQGFEFDIDQKTCRPIAPGGCTMGPTPTVPSEVFTTQDWTTHEPSTDASSATNEAEVTSTVADDETIATTNSPNPPVLPECPLGIFGNFPHPERCDAYYMCAGGVAILFNCSQGFEFDIDQKTCRPIAPGGCTMGPTTTVPSEVFTTQDWTTHEPSTDASSATNEAEVTSTVADDETIATTNSPNPPVLPECPLGIFGNFPHPERCDAYYMCAGGVAILFNCSQGFEFDIDQKTCRPIAPGGCTMGPTTTVPSEVFTTQDWTTHEPSCCGARN